MRHTIIDRRKNPGGKNMPNRQRFVKRIRGQISNSIRRKMGDRDITDVNGGENIKVRRKSVHEPEFRNDPNTGERDIILPGNTDYVPGDTIKKPKGGAGGPGPGEASDGGEGQDDFDFAISNEEYIDMLFEDLELPNMAKKENRLVESFERMRSGYSNEGNPSQLNLVQSMRNSVGRRVALKKPKKKRIAALEAELQDTTNKKRREEILLEIERLKKRHDRIPFLDPTDLRFNNYTKVPKPTSQAVIFCVMDISASMGITHKDIAKRFFLLLNLFITRKYKRTDIVFIRHHHQAFESTEEEFFQSRDNGGTVVSCAFDMVDDIIKKRYPPEQWNIYVAQATDGDNFDTDNERLTGILNERIIPLAQHFCYIHVDDGANAGSAYYNSGNKKLTRIMKGLAEQHENVVVKNIEYASDVYRIFREIFGDQGNG